MFAELLFDPLRQKNLEQLAAECFFLERKTVARQLLRDSAAALAHVACGQILQCCTDDPEEIVAAVLVEFCVLHRHNRADEVLWQLFIRHGLAVFHVDLAKDLAVAIQNHAGRFHLLEPI